MDKKKLAGWMILILWLVPEMVRAQSLTSAEFDLKEGFRIKSFNGFQQPGYDIPLVSFELDDREVNTLKGETRDYSVVVEKKLEVAYFWDEAKEGLKASVTFRNVSDDTLTLANVVPFGASSRHVYITGYGKNPLSRSHLFRPGYDPVNVLLPDNAWELGFAVLNVDNGNSITCIPAHS